QDHGSSTDWQDQITRTSFSHTHNLSYSNGYDTGNYRVSLSYSDQQGIIKNSSMERLNGRLNFNQRLFKDKLKLGAQITISRVNDEAPLITNNAGFEGDLLGASYMANPTWPSDPDFQFSNSNLNPLSMLKYYQDKTKTNRSLINLSAEYDFTNEFNVKVNTGFDNSSSDRDGVLSPELFMGDGVFGNGRAFISEIETSSQLLEVLFNYRKEFENSKLTALLGYSYQEFNNEGRNYQGWGFSGTNMNGIVDDLKATDRIVRNSITGAYQQYGYGTDGAFVNRLFPEPVSETITVADTPARAAVSDWYNYTDELQSFFGRINYTLKDRYLFTATLRADGSSKFGGNNKYGYFPSGAFAWILSDEEFIPEAFYNLKLRLGYGVTGNQELPHNLYQTRQRYGGLGVNDSGVVQSSGLNDLAFANPDLKWEQTQQFNIGIDFGFWDNRFNGSVDLYRKNTTDLLMQITSAQPASQPFVYRNLDADVINKGFEITLNYGLIETEDFTWDLSTNFSYNDNVVKNFDGIVDTGGINGQGLTGAFAQRIEDGQPLFSYFLREFTGYDENGLSTYEGGDLQKFVGKSALPKYNLGISTNFRYKSWDLSAFFSGQFGHYIYNNTQNAFFTAGSIGNGRNVTKDVLGSEESGANAPDVSTRFLEKGDFLRLQNITLGHNFEFADKSKVFKSLRIYLNAQNLVVITDYSGLDPEVNTNKELNGVPSLGIDYTSYPRPRTFTLGLNASF
ncbi:SusC/RagA family TonB-linked outer membrane protein, partial [Sinomicrobium weinanense]